MKRNEIPRVDIEEALDEVRQVYADLAKRPIERNCQRVKECCHFKLTGRTPYLTKGEALLAAKALRATGRTQLRQSKTGACPLLDSDTGNCLIYDARPFGCRTHFCLAAGGPYARREVIDLIRRLELINVEVGGTAARPLQNAITDALNELIDSNQSKSSRGAQTARDLAHAVALHKKHHA